MRTIEDTFKNADFLQPKVYNRYKLGVREEIKEMFIKSFEYYDRTVDKYEHLPAYDEIIDWMVDTKGRGLMLMGECGLGKSTILNFVIPAIFRTRTNKILRSVPAKELGAVDRNKAPFIIIDDLGTESIKNDYGTKIDEVNHHNPWWPTMYKYEREWYDKINPQLYNMNDLFSGTFIKEQFGLDVKPYVKMYEEWHNKNCKFLKSQHMTNYLP